MNPSDDMQHQPYAAQPVQPIQQQQSGQNQQYSDDGQQPRVVYMARPMEPVQQEISPEVKQKHEQSVQQFPNLHLSDNEYVISAVKRHPIGVINTWTVVILLIAAMVGLAGLLASTTHSGSGGISGTSIPLVAIVIPVFLISTIALLFGYIAAYVYNANKFYLTNESVIQHIQTSLFAQREQTISLGNIEDASFTQNGILPEMLGYGLIRLSTPGNETTYRFTYASNPKQQIALLNDAVEAFKNGRPIRD